VVTGDVKLVIIMLKSMVLVPAVIDPAVAVSVVAASVFLALQCPFIEIREHTHLPLLGPKRESTLPKNHIAIATIRVQQAIAKVWWAVVPYNPLSDLLLDPVIPPPTPPIPQPRESLLTNQQDIVDQLPSPFGHTPQPTPPKQQLRQR
jgi:hypothetical protein